MSVSIPSILNSRQLRVHRKVLDGIGLQEFSMACGTSRNGDTLRYGMLFGLTVAKVTQKNVKTGWKAGKSGELVIRPSR